METFEAPKHSTLVGYYYRTLATHFKLDAGRRLVKLYQKPQRRPTLTCRRRSCRIHSTLFTPISYLTLPRVFVTSTLVM